MLDGNHHQRLDQLLEHDLAGTACDILMTMARSNCSTGASMVGLGANGGLFSDSGVGSGRAVRP